MNVLIEGANGYLGPHVVKALAPHHHLRITDVKPPPAEILRNFPEHEFLDVDVTSPSQAINAARDMDAIINLSVVRHDRVLAFHVNAIGCHNVMQAAVKHRIQRIINTGPYITIAGPSYERFDHGISPDVPPHPGTNLYALSKSLGQEICRAFTLTYDIYVQDYLFYSLCDAGQLKLGAGGVPFVISWAEAAEVFRLGLRSFDWAWRLTSPDCRQIARYSLYSRTVPKRNLATLRLNKCLDLHPKMMCRFYGEDTPVVMTNLVTVINDQLCATARSGQCD